MRVAPYWVKRKEAAAYFGNSLSEVGVAFLDFLSAGEFSVGSAGGRETPRQTERERERGVYNVFILYTSTAEV